MAKNQKNEPQTVAQATESSFLTWRSEMQKKFTATSMMVDFVKYPVMTEKTYRMFLKNRQYTFNVDLRLTKPQIKKLFEQLFDVNIIGINTHRPPRQKGGGSKGSKANYKRTILTLKEGQSINF
jgi:large subunit ribosomal protein L23